MYFQVEIDGYIFDDSIFIRSNLDKVSNIKTEIAKNFLSLVDELAFWLNIKISKIKKNKNDSFPFQKI